MKAWAIPLSGVVVLAWAVAISPCAAQSPKLEKEITGFYGSPVFGPDGKTVALVSGAESIVLWDCESGKKVVLKGAVKHGIFRPLAFCSDGKLLATAGSDITVRVWDSSSGKEVMTLRGHAKDINWLRFSVDGKELMSASWEETVVKRWDVATGKEISSQ